MRADHATLLEHRWPKDPRLAVRKRPGGGACARGSRIFTLSFLGGESLSYKSKSIKEKYMESKGTVSNQPGGMSSSDQSKLSMGGGASQTSTQGGRVAAATQTAKEVTSTIASGAQQALDQTKQAGREAYEKTSGKLN